MMRRELSQIASGIVLGIVLAVMTVNLVGCSGASTADARVRSALDVLVLVVDPAYSFAVDACAARQLLIAEEVEGGRMTPDDADVALRPIRARCHATRRAFDAIREAQDQAATLVEAGKVEEAEQMLDQVRARWAALRGEKTDELGTLPDHDDAGGDGPAARPAPADGG
jgi:hypothetical protein